jgi:DNA-binding CsgD family transcriptional regulator
LYPAIINHDVMAKVTKTKLKTADTWFDRMQTLFLGARYTAAGDIFDKAAHDGQRPSADAVLLRARILLKLGSDKVTSFLLRQYFDDASPRQLATRAMYLGTGLARLGDFDEADRYFGQAKAVFRRGIALGELAAHLSRRYLLQRDLESAETWRHKSLVDRSLGGRIRSEHLNSYILARREKYHEQAESLLAVLDLIGDRRQAYVEDWYVAVYSLAGLARELPMAAAANRARAAVDIDMEWSSDFAVHRFQAIKSTAWCQALDGNELGCLRYLRLAGHAAPSSVWQTILLLDRAYFASIVGEEQWAANEFAAAEEIAEKIDWEETFGEERVALLLLAELAAVHATKRAPYYLARFNHLGRLRVHLQHFAFDDRLNAMASFTSGIVKAADGQAKAAEDHLREAWSAFDRIGYDVRAARSALALYRITGKSRWLHLAEDKLEKYPRAWLSRELRLSTRGQSGGAHGRPKLPRMQDAVVRLVCEGLPTGTIAKRLDLSRNTVLNHLKVIYKKLGVNSREALVVEAMKRKLTE